VSVVGAAVAMTLLLVVDLPILQRIFTPTAPTERSGTRGPVLGGPKTPCCADAFRSRKR